MTFLDPTLESFQKHISKLTAETPAEWGRMSAQGMVEHLSDWLDLASTPDNGFSLEIPEDKVPKAQAFLFSEHPLPRNFQVKFLPPETNHRNESLPEAIEEFESKWSAFEEFHKNNPGVEIMHPSFGMLDHKKLMALHGKHMTHHFQQFNLV